MFQPLFPPFLDKGSKDLGQNGPVRFLQNLLIANASELAKAIGLVPDGDYGDRTLAMVAFLQYGAMEEFDMQSSDVDGNFGPATRRILSRQWELRLDEIPYQEGSACMYMAPGFTEPQLWDFCLSEPGQTVVLENATPETEPAPVVPLDEEGR